MDTPIIPQKQCSKCKQYFEATNKYFAFDNQKKDGFCSYCKSCRKVKTRRNVPDGYIWCPSCKSYLERSLEYFIPSAVDAITRFSATCKKCQCEITRSQYSPHPKVKMSDEQLKANKRKCDIEYAKKNKEKLQAYYREYYEQNKTVIRARIDRWIEDNPDQVRANNKSRKSKRRALEKNAEGFHNADDLKKQYDNQNGLCWWCSVKLDDKWHADHLIPLNRGGSNWPNNIVCSCPYCNLSRGDKLPHEWSGRLF